nr:hypothetical protein [Deinococcus sp. S9]
MAQRRFCPGGRVLAGAGTQHGNVLNCFVQGATEHAPESFDGIMEVAKKLALVTKVGGGNGVNLDVYTPRAQGSRPDKTLRGLNGGLYGSYNGRLVGSKADLIAVALETFQKELEAAALPPLAGGSVDLPAPPAPSGVSVEHMDGIGRERCPVCEEKAVIREEGCLKCQACGQSRCG